MIPVEALEPGASVAAVADRHLQGGYRTIVDLDLAQFFDRVHHQRPPRPHWSVGGGSSGDRSGAPDTEGGGRDAGRHEDRRPGRNPASSLWCSPEGDGVSDAG